MGRFGRRWIELAGLWALAVAQPLFSLLSDSGDFLVARGNGWPDTPLVVVALIVLPPTVMAAIEMGAGALAGRVGSLSARRRDIEVWIHAVFVGGLVIVFAVQFLKEHMDPSSRMVQVLALVAGVAAAVGLVYTRFVPAFLVVLSPAALILPIWFLAFSPVAAIAWPQGTEDKASKADTVPVVMVVLDEFSTASILDPRGRIDRTRFPNLARLAQRTTWFRNATTVADGTIHAVPAILTGQLKPDRDVLPIASDYPPSIIARLGDSWRFNVHESATTFCGGLCTSRSASWETRAVRLGTDLGKIMRQRVRRGPPPTTFLAPPENVTHRSQDVRDWIGRIQGGRTLNLIHIELPHSPYQYDADGRRYTDVDTLPGLDLDNWDPDPKYAEEGYRRYMLQAEFTDRLVGEMMDRLDRTGLWDKAIVLVTADHGVAFQPGKSRRAAVPVTAGEVAGIPMFFKAPGQKQGGVNDTAVRNTDLVPTVGDYLNADWKLPGHSLRDPVGHKDVDVWVRFGPRVKMPLAFFTELRRQAVTRLRAIRGAPNLDVSSGPAAPPTAP